MARISGLNTLFMPPGRDILIVAVVVVLCALSGYMGSRMSQREMVPLYAGELPRQETEALKRQLDSMKISFEVAGSRILVPSRQRAALWDTLADYGFPHSYTTPKSEFDKKIASQHELEEQLGTDIRKLTFVEDASVRLVPTDEDALPGEREDAKARVLVLFERDAQPTPEQIDAIVDLVAYASPGLNASHVRVVDHAGHVWLGTYGQTSNAAHK